MPQRHRSVAASFLAMLASIHALINPLAEYVSQLYST